MFSTLCKVGWSRRTDIIWYEKVRWMYSKPAEEELLVQLYCVYYRSLLSPMQYSEDGGAYMGLKKVSNNVLSERKGDHPAGDMAP